MNECPNCRGLRRRLDEVETSLARLQAFMSVARLAIEADDPEEFGLLEAELALLEGEFE